MRILWSGSLAVANAWVWACWLVRVRVMGVGLANDGGGGLAAAMWDGFEARGLTHWVAGWQGRQIEGGTRARKAWTTPHACTAYVCGICGEGARWRGTGRGRRGGHMPSLPTCDSAVWGMRGCARAVQLVTSCRVPRMCAHPRATDTPPSLFSFSSSLSSRVFRTLTRTHVHAAPPPHAARLVANCGRGPQPLRPCACVRVRVCVTGADVASSPTDTCCLVAARVRVRSDWCRGEPVTCCVHACACAWLCKRCVIVYGRGGNGRC